MILSVSDWQFIIEALQMRASRLEAYARQELKSIGSNERKAAAMRKLAKRLQGRSNDQEPIDRPQSA